MFENNQKLRFEESTHQYFLDEIPMQSVTRFLSRFEPPFDAEQISWFMARTEVRKALNLTKSDPDPRDGSIERRALEIRLEWDAKRDEASEHGTMVHKMMEEYFNNGKVLYPKTESFLKDLKSQYDQIYKDYKCEVKVVSEELGLAGTMDIALLRKTRQPILDIEDFKTNLTKGICFDSISRKDAKIKHRNQYFLEPLNHLELCNYNRYALQLSLYAYLLELQHNIKIGRLAVKWVEFDQGKQVIISSYLIPVPFLKNDIARICKVTRQVVENSIETKW